MFDRYNRKIDYLRVSIIDTCNLRCTYCMPENGAPLKQHDNILSYEQIDALVREAVALGIIKVRLTGGEPLVRPHVEHLVGRLSQIDGLQELCMTTNGIGLSRLAHKLKENGLNRLNISIDTLDPDKYLKITGSDKLEQAMAGLNASIDAGFEGIKINMVIFDNTTAEEVDEMRNFCEQKGAHLQKIMQFSLYDRDGVQMRFEAERPPPCHICNRIRVTADGFIKPCLHSDIEIPIDFSDIRGSILEAVGVKPESGSSCESRAMLQIGG